MIKIPRPLGDNLIVRVKEVAETTASGIVLPEEAKEKPVTGIVLDVGKYVSNAVQVGDEILFNQYAGEELVYNDVKYLMLNEPEVMGVVE